jgi:uncharacterized protein (TIGR04255 family)
MMGDESSVIDDLKHSQNVAVRVPLAEVAYGVRFVAPEFDVIRFGEYRQLIKDQFPKHSVVPPILAQRSTDPFNQTIEVPSLPRLWFESGNRLIQLQSDRFIYNWRRVGGLQEKYPGYPILFKEFRERWEQFVGYTRTAFQLPLHIEELSLTYINQIRDADSSQIATFSFRNEVPIGDLPSPDVWISQLRFSLAEENAKLTVSARPAIDLSTREQVTQLDVIVESMKAPSSDNSADFHAWFETAHDLVHRGFRALVRREQRSQWGFVDDNGG